MKTMILTALFAAAPALAAQTEWKSVYTDLKKDCVVEQQSNDKSEIDFYTAQCKAFGGYSLEVSGGDIRYAPVLKYRDSEIPMGRPSHFHDTGSDKVEWMYERTSEEDGTGSLAWRGFIYRLSVAKDDGEGNDSVLYAVRLDGEKSCFLGSPATNEAARALVRNAKAPCVEQPE